MGQLTVYSDFYFPHIRCSNIIQGAAFILPRLVTFDVRDFQIFILTHKALAFWEERDRNNEESVKPGKELYSHLELVGKRSTKSHNNGV